MYADATSQVLVNDLLIQEFPVGDSVHQGSILSHLLFIIVLKALSHEFCTSVLWKLLYEEDLAEELTECLEKFKTWKNKKLNAKVCEST